MLCMRHVHLSLVLTMAMCWGCQRAPDDVEYFPLTPGITWQYRLTRTTMDGSREQRYALANVALAASDDPSLHIRETLDGQRYYYRQTEAGITRIGTRRRRGNRIVEDDRLQLVFPAHPQLATAWQAPTTTSVLENSGPPWENTFRVMVPVTMQYRVRSLTASVDTPAGRFPDCLLMAGEGHTTVDVGSNLGSTEITISSREWYSPHAGLVRLERDEHTSAPALGHGSIVMELDNWHRP